MFVTPQGLGPYGWTERQNAYLFLLICHRSATNIRHSRWKKKNVIFANYEDNGKEPDL